MAPQDGIDPRIQEIYFNCLSDLLEFHKNFRDEIADPSKLDDKAFIDLYGNYLKILEKGAENYISQSLQYEIDLAPGGEHYHRNMYLSCKLREDMKGEVSNIAWIKHVGNFENIQETLKDQRNLDEDHPLRIRLDLMRQGLTNTAVLDPVYGPPPLFKGEEQFQGYYRRKAQKIGGSSEKSAEENYNTECKDDFALNKKGVLQNEGPESEIGNVEFNTTYSP